MTNSTINNNININTVNISNITSPAPIQPTLNNNNYQNFVNIQKKQQTMFNTNSKAMSSNEEITVNNNNKDSILSKFANNIIICNF